MPGAARLFDLALRWLAGALVVALLAAVTAGVLSRALGHPFAWTDEASGYLMAWLACAGWMLATRHHSHIRIRFFQDRLGARTRRGTEVALQLGVALVGAAVAWGAVHLVRTNADIESMALPVSAAWLYVPLVPAGIMTCVQALLDLRLPSPPSSPQAPPP